MKKLTRVRATLRDDDWFGIATRYSHDLAAALRRIRPHEFTRAEWVADARIRRATWWFPLRRLDAVRLLLHAHDIELEIEGDAFDLRFRYRDTKGRFARRRAP